MNRLFLDATRFISKKFFSRFVHFLIGTKKFRKSRSFYVWTNINVMSDERYRIKLRLLTWSFEVSLLACFDTPLDTMLCDKLKIHYSSSPTLSHPSYVQHIWNKSLLLSIFLWKFRIQSWNRQCLWYALPISKCSFYILYHYFSTDIFFSNTDYIVLMISRSRPPNLHFYFCLIESWTKMSTISSPAFIELYT